MKKLFGLLLPATMLLAGCANAANIGIIGGADGPTAIFVTSSINWWAMGGLVLAAIAAIVLIIGLIRRAKKK